MLSIRGLMNWGCGALAALIIGACGGGGDAQPASASAQPREPLSALSLDVDPTGARVDLRGKNYFPMTAADHWTYKRTGHGLADGQIATRSFVAAGGADVNLIEESDSQTDVTLMRRTPQGLLAVNPTGGIFPVAASQTIGDLLLYPEPFFAAGAKRRSIRQGPFGEDLDGDGSDESFRLETDQKWIGFDELDLGFGVLKELVKFETVVTITVYPSSMDYPVNTVTLRELTWWAAGLGLVRSESSWSDGDREVLELQSAVVSGVNAYPPPVDGTAIKLALATNAVIYDARRNRYYASIAASAGANASAIATIDPANGVTNYAGGFISTDPGPMALSADGNMLFVGFKGTGDVVALSLPQMQVQWRVQLPILQSLDRLIAESLAASPTEPGVLAVSTYRLGVADRHYGVMLIRDGVAQPTVAQENLGSNLIVFDGNGQHIYGYSLQGGAGLRRLSFVTDGLVQDMTVAVTTSGAVHSLAWTTRGLMLEETAYRSETLDYLGYVATAGGRCREHQITGKLICANHEPFQLPAGTDTRNLAVVNPETFAIETTPAYERGPTAAHLTEIIPGPARQVALRMGATRWNQAADGLWLFSIDAPQ